MLKEYLKGKSQDELKFLKPMFANIEKLWNSSGLDVTIKELQAIRDIEGLVPDIEVTFDSYKDMDQFVAENKIEMPDLMTKDGEIQFFGFAQDFSKTLDPKFVKLSMFVSSFGGGTFPPEGLPLKPFSIARCELFGRASFSVIFLSSSFNLSTSCPPFPIIIPGLAVVIVTVTSLSVRSIITRETLALLNLA